MEGCGPIANQRVKSSIVVRLANGKERLLPAGSLVKFIRIEYLSKDHPFYDIDEDLYCVCYTQLGMALVPNCELEMAFY